MLNKPRILERIFLKDVREMFNNTKFCNFGSIEILFRTREGHLFYNRVLVKLMNLHSSTSEQNSVFIRNSIFNLILSPTPLENIHIKICCQFSRGFTTIWLTDSNFISLLSTNLLRRGANTYPPFGSPMHLSMRWLIFWYDDGTHICMHKISRETVMPTCLLDLR